MFKHKVTQTLLALLAFFVILSAAAVVGDDSFGSKFSQLASVTSSQKGDVSGSKDSMREGDEDPLPCRLSPEESAKLTKYNQFGDGLTLGTRFEIYNAKQLISIKDAGMDSYHKHFLQCNDINLTNEDQFTIPFFFGYYHGNYKKIIGYHYQGLDSEPKALFESLFDGSIEHLRLLNASVDNPKASILAGYITSSNINDIKVYDSSVNSGTDVGVASGLLTYVSTSQVSNIEVSNVSVKGTFLTSGVVHQMGFPGVLKNVKVTAGNVSTTNLANGSASGVVNVAYSNPSQNGVSTFENISFTGSVSGPAVAGIAHSLSGVKLKNSHVYSSVLVANPTGTSTYSTGGVVGYMNGATLEKSYFSGQLTRKSSVQNTCFPASHLVGGVVGWASNSSIYWSYAGARPIIIENNCGYTGGVVGRADGTVIQNSFASGVLQMIGRNGYIGGLVGFVNTPDSAPALKNNYSSLSFSADSGTQASVLGGHFGLVVASGLSDQWNFTNAGQFPPIAQTAGPFVGKFTASGIGIPPLPFTHYYSSNTVCAGLNPNSCNSIGTSTPFTDLMNPNLDPLKKWTFASDSWVQSPAGTAPSIPTAGSTY